MNQPTVSLNDINTIASSHPEALIRRDESQYARQLCETAGKLLQGGQKIILLAGPSGSGKTTTAHMLSHEMARLGIRAAVVSLDDFYLNPQNMPLLPDGSPDFESVHSLDLDHLHHCLSELVEHGRCDLPVFDFVSHRIDGETRSLVLSKGDVVIFEGLHALNPLISDCLPADQVCRLHVFVGRSIEQDGRVLLSARDLRLIRRMIRDSRFRNSSPANTLLMWKGVVHGEERYLKPYEHTAQMVIDSLHSYEPCVYREPLERLLDSMEPKDKSDPLIQRIGTALSEFVPLPSELVPEHSLLREFIG